jgi:hypothetical protein
MRRKQSVMHVNPSCVSASERILDGMIELARCSRLDRVIVGGATAPELMLGLHCRGYARVATVATCGLPHGQYGVALVNWEGRSIKALETTLDWLVQYLGSSAVLVIRMDPLERIDPRQPRIPDRGRGPLRAWFRYLGMPPERAAHAGGRVSCSHDPSESCACVCSLPTGGSPPRCCRDHQNRAQKPLRGSIRRLCVDPHQTASPPLLTLSNVRSGRGPASGNYYMATVEASASALNLPSCPTHKETVGAGWPGRRRRVILKDGDML